MSNGALQDLLVLDMTRALAGPYCTMLLADQGATVIKVEAPNTGDGTRKMVPFPPDIENREPYGGYFQSVNRNKQSIVVDLKAPEGKEIIRTLAASADILVENFRAGVMEGLDLAYESLRERNPALVYAAVRGFGDPRTGDSPYRDWPAYDVIAQAMGGMISVTGTAAGDPIKVGPGVGDLIPATLAAFGIMSAVHHARRTGEGQFIDVAMYDAVLAFSERIVPQFSYTGEVPGPDGNAHPTLCPFGLFPASDGWVAIACPGDQFWMVLAELMGRQDLLEDERCRNNYTRVQNSDLVTAAVSEWTAAHTKGELTAILGGKIPFGPVNNAADLFNDPHLAARDMLAMVEQPGSAGRYAIPNTPIRMTRTQGGVHSRAPLLGEHTEEVLQRAGLDEKTIAQLREKQVIQ